LVSIRKVARIDSKSGLADATLTFSPESTGEAGTEREVAPSPSDAGSDDRLWTRAVSNVTFMVLLLYLF
jgi:hypothetical protein